MTQTDKDFYSGVLSALSVVYHHDDPTSVYATEIVSACGAKGLLIAAKAEDYNRLKELQETINYLDKLFP